MVDFEERYFVDHAAFDLVLWPYLVFPEEFVAGEGGVGHKQFEEAAQGVHYLLAGYQRPVERVYFFVEAVAGDVLGE